MRVVVQRVNKASVTVNGRIESQINTGMLVLLGVELQDTTADADWICSKLAKMRIFNDVNGVMNRTIQEENGEFLVVSQFTLHASTKKGNRPSYIKSAKPTQAIPLYEYVLDKLWMESERPVKAGVFGAHMNIALENDGPVTIIMDSKNKE